MQTWKLHLNPKKSQVIQFARKKKKTLSSPIYYGRTRINRSATVKFLGVTLDEKLTWRANTTASINKAKGAAAAIHPLLKSPHLALDTKKVLYTAMIRPIITYGYPAWGSIATSHLKKLEVLQNRALRTITGAPWFVRNSYIHSNLQIKTIPEFLLDIATSFEDSLHRTENELLTSIWTYQNNPHFKYPRSRRALTHPIQ